MGTYAPRLRALFSGLELDGDDLLLLEAAQIASLHARVSARSFAAILHHDGRLRRCLVAKYPPVRRWFEEIMAKYPAVTEARALASLQDDVVWEIADMLVFVKDPDIYDERAHPGWDFAEVLEAAPVAGKVVLDVGAGTGIVTFEAARSAATVYAVEPVAALRRYIRLKAAKQGVTNVYTADGRLHQVPFPADFGDVLVTARAIGWHLEDELAEIERVVRPGGRVVHLSGYAADEPNPIHATMISREWGYSVSRYQERSGTKLKYYKAIS